MLKAVASILVLFVSVSVFAKESNKTLATCEVADNEAGLESLSITQLASGKLQAEVTVSGAGDFMETYKYSVRHVPPAPGRLGAPLVYAANGGKFELSICATCAPMDRDGARHGSVSFIAPQSSQMDPGGKIKFDNLICNLNN